MRGNISAPRTAAITEQIITAKPPEINGRKNLHMILIMAAHKTVKRIPKCFLAGGTIMARNIPYNTRPSAGEIEEGRSYQGAETKNVPDTHPRVEISITPYIYLGFIVPSFVEQTANISSVIP